MSRSPARTTRATVLLLHGVSSGPRSWERVAKALGQRSRLDVIDLYAHGWFDRFDVTRSVAWLADRLASHGHPTDVVGHSLGGVLAARVAIAHPSVVRRLVLVSTPGLPVGVTTWTRAVAVARSTGKVHPGTMPLLAVGLLRAGPLRLWGGLREGMRADLSAQLPSIRCPTLLVWGADDAVVPVQIGLRMEVLVPGARLAILPGAGHMPMWEQPAAFVRVVGAFLDARPPGRPMDAG